LAILKWLDNGFEPHRPQVHPLTASIYERIDLRFGRVRVRRFVSLSPLLLLNRPDLLWRPIHRLVRVGLGSTPGSGNGDGELPLVDHLAEALLLCLHLGDARVVIPFRG